MECLLSASYSAKLDADIVCAPGVCILVGETIYLKQYLRVQIDVLPLLALYQARLLAQN